MLRLWFVLAVNYVHVQPSLLEEQRHRMIHHYQKNHARLKWSITLRSTAVPMYELKKTPLRKRSSCICRNYRPENTFIWEHHYDFRRATQVKKIPTAVNPPEQQMFRDDSSAGPTTKLSMKIVIFFFYQEPWEVGQDDLTVIPSNLNHSMIL